MTNGRLDRYVLLEAIYDEVDGSTTGSVHYDNLSERTGAALGEIIDRIADLGAEGLVEGVMSTEGPVSISSDGVLWVEQKRGGVATS